MSLWFGETTLRDASILTSIAATATTKIQLGTAILNIYTRTPSQLALLGSTLNEFSQGRFTLGLGVSTGAIVEAWHGVPFVSPMARMDETVRIIRLYYSGEKFSFRGKHSSPNGARLKTSFPPKIAIAALNDGMLRKAATIGDRIILNLYSVDRIKHATGIINDACKSAGKTAPILSVMLYTQLTNINDNLDPAKDLISFYASSPAYSLLFSNSGFSKEAKAMQEAWKKKDRTAVKSNVTEEMIKKFMLVGSMQNLRERIRQYHEAGVNDVFISPSPFGNYEETLNAVITSILSPK